jgi:Dyp-type peroxidase family
MPVNLNQTLAWHHANADEAAMLTDLQANILKGHGRHHTRHMFLHFDVGQRQAARAFVHSVAASLTDAHTQLLAAAANKNGGADGGTVRCCFLSARGYGALGRADLKPTPAGLAAGDADVFEDGMQQRAEALMDPPVHTWEAPYSHVEDGLDIHAMLLLADDDEARCTAERNHWANAISATGSAVRLLGEEQGRAMTNDDEQPIEHFGYVDGRSQPLMLAEDVAAERAAAGLAVGQAFAWDPTVTLAQVLVPSPGGQDGISHGSYFVFRKLEQNVRGFKKDEQRLASVLGLGAGLNDPARVASARELAGAMVIGRFENGREVISFDTDTPSPGRHVANNFNYAGDPHGLKCPFASHLRKSNPRSDVRDFKGPLMARRGITYGRRGIEPKDDPEFGDMPTGDAGLLFMAYQANLAAQFEFTQRAWVNAPDFVHPGVGIDPVIGQATAPNGQHWPSQWGEAMHPQAYDFSRWVTMLGGEYFFAPAISTLATL